MLSYKVRIRALAPSLVLSKGSQLIVAEVPPPRIVTGPTVVILVQKLHLVALTGNQSNRLAGGAFNQRYVLPGAGALAKPVPGKYLAMSRSPQVPVALLSRPIVVGGAVKDPLLVPITMFAAKIICIVAVLGLHIIVFIPDRLVVLVLVADLNFAASRCVKNIGGVAEDPNYTEDPRNNDQCGAKLNQQFLVAQPAVG